MIFLIAGVQWSLQIVCNLAVLRESDVAIARSCDRHYAIVHCHGDKRTVSEHFLTQYCILTSKLAT